jgi:hypothetical protein
MFSGISSSLKFLTPTQIPELSVFGAAPTSSGSFAEDMEVLPKLMLADECERVQDAQPLQLSTHG